MLIGKKKLIMTVIVILKFLFYEVLDLGCETWHSTVYSSPMFSTVQIICSDKH